MTDMMASAHMKFTCLSILPLVETGGERKVNHEHPSRGWLTWPRTVYTGEGTRAGIVFQQRVYFDSARPLSPRLSFERDERWLLSGTSHLNIEEYALHEAAGAPRVSRCKRRLDGGTALSPIDHRAAGQSPRSEP